MKWSIVVVSDLHFGNETIRERKKDQLFKILDTKEFLNTQMVICAGDLTDDGTDGATFCGLRKKTNDQLTPLINEWVQPLDNNGLVALLTIGNHDTYTGHPYTYKPVFNFIKKRHGATCYPMISMFKSGYYKYEKNGVVFLSLGVYPVYLSWIAKNLVRDKPMILFYHYNTDDNQPYSNFWTAHEKYNFFELIKSYTNIICIINGHFHRSSKDTYLRNFRFVNGAGEKMVSLHMDGDKLESTSYL